jgi:hypothetical protein
VIGLAFPKADTLARDVAPCAGGAPANKELWDFQDVWFVVFVAEGPDGNGIEPKVGAVRLVFDQVGLEEIIDELAFRKVRKTKKPLKSGTD